MDDKKLTGLLFIGMDDIEGINYEHLSRPIDSNILKLIDKNGDIFIITVNKYGNINTFPNK